MLFRSTGLGKTELSARIFDVTRQGDYLIMHVDTIDPVKWRIRAGISIKDLLKLVRSVLKISIITFLLMPTNWFKEAKHPGEF